MTPYHQSEDGRLTLHNGDCLDVLKAMDECSVDAVVTDPPYGLGESPDMLACLRAWMAGDRYVPKRGTGFMGKEWDAFVPGPEVWRECFRVLKPGGHVLAFFGSRTLDVGGLAIRLAGFEIRDTLSWNFGTGFPKSLDVAKAMTEKGLLCECAGSDSVCGVRQAPVDVARMAEADQGADVFPQVQRNSARSRVGEAWPQGEGRVDTGWTTSQGGSAARGAESRVEGRGDVSIQERQLYRSCVCEMSEGVPGDGSQRWLCDGAPTRDGPGVGPLPHADGGGSSPRPQPSEQRAGESGVVPGQRDAQTCRGCGKTKRSFVEGRGTALKPAWEPIVLARKPLVGTVAANVQAHGTGALNIDGCRIGTSKDVPSSVSRAQGVSLTGSVNGSLRKATGTESGFDPNVGRWPANIALDEEAAAALDAQTGILKSGAWTGNHNTPKTKNTFGAFAGDPSRETPREASEGGASRFFFIAKASRSERDAGCDGLPLRTGGEATDREDESAGLDSPRAGAGRTGGARNIHPTVKPVALMRWLVRLVTPPDGLVLDPFAGSGTTLVAARDEGFRAVGVEREADYCEIAMHRMKYDAEAQARAEAEKTVDKRQATFGW